MKEARLFGKSVQSFGLSGGSSAGVLTPLQSVLSPLGEGFRRKAF
jgi:hypothetical protein